MFKCLFKKTPTKSRLWSSTIAKSQLKKKKYTTFNEEPDLAQFINEGDLIQYDEFDPIL